MGQGRCPRRPFAHDATLLKDVLQEPFVLGWVALIQSTTEHRHRDATSVQRGLVGCRVNAARLAGNDGHSGARNG
jgi:hypothetical protein